MRNTATTIHPERGQVGLAAPDREGVAAGDRTVPGLAHLLVEAARPAEPDTTPSTLAYGFRA